MMDIDPIVVLRLVIAGSAMASLIGSGEWIALHAHMRDNAIYSWLVEAQSAPRRALALAPLFRSPTIIALPLLQASASIILLIPNVGNTAAAVSCLVAALCYYLMSLRGIDGFNGGDAMAKVVMLAGGIGLLAGSSTAAMIVLMFLSGQLIVAYSTPGWHRIFDRGWHDGSKILGVMRTESFGRRAIWTFLQNRPKFSRFVSSCIAVWESCFIVYPFLPLWMLLPVLGIGVVFHLSNAIVMGLNIFPWSFLGVYPAFVWTSMWINDHLWQGSSAPSHSLFIPFFAPGGV